MLYKEYNADYIKDSAYEIWIIILRIFLFSFYFGTNFYNFSKLFLIFRDNIYISKINHYFILVKCDTYSIYRCQYIAHIKSAKYKKVLDKHNIFLLVVFMRANIFNDY